MLDIAVLLGIFLGTGAAIVRIRRSGARSRRLLLGGWAAFQGVTLVAMMGAHSAEIVYHLVTGGTRFDGTAWAYDFRSYSLLLMGAVLGAIGVRFIRLSPELGRGEPSARRGAVRAKLALLAVVFPLLPIHPFFGVILTTVGSVGLLMLLLARPEMRAAAPAIVEPVRPRLVAIPTRAPARRPLALSR